MKKAHHFIAVSLTLASLSVLAACGETEEATAPETEPRAAAPAEQVAGADQRAIETSLRKGVQIEGNPVENYELSERMAYFDVPDLSIAVAEGGDIQWAKCYGTCEGSDAVFQSASLSKAVAATGIVTFARNAGIGLDDDISGLITSMDLSAQNPDGVPITLRALLSHTNGAAVSGFPGYAADADIPTTTQVVEGSGPTNTDPVTFSADAAGRFQYSGGGYTVAQLLVEEVSGRPFAELMDELVLAPIGMTDSTFGQPPADEFVAGRELAVAHDGEGNLIPGRFHLYPEMAAAGLWTTPSDYLRFGLALANAYQGDAETGIDPEVARDVLTPIENDYGLGMGSSIREGIRRMGHSGSNRGYRAFFEGYVETGDGAVVMTNASQGAAVSLEVLRAVNIHYGWSEPGIRTISPVMLSAEQLERFEGTYRFGNDAVFTIEATETGYDGRQPDGNTFTLLPLNANTFIDPDDGQELGFVEDDQGVAAIFRGQRFPRVEPASE